MVSSFPRALQQEIAYFVASCEPFHTRVEVGVVQARFGGS